MKNRNILKKFAVSLTMIGLSLSQISHAEQASATTGKNFKRYNIVRKYDVHSVVDYHNNMTTFKATYELKRGRSLIGGNLKLIIQCIRMDNRDPFYQFGDNFIPVTSQEECSQEIMEINRLMDTGSSPEIFYNSKTNEFLIVGN